MFTCLLDFWSCYPPDVHGGILCLLLRRNASKVRSFGSNLNDINTFILISFRGSQRGFMGFPEVSRGFLEGFKGVLRISDG